MKDFGPCLCGDPECRRCFPGYVPDVEAVEPEDEQSYRERTDTDVSGLDCPERE